MAKGEEDETIARLVPDAEAQEVDDTAMLRNAILSPGHKWWDITMGKHDQETFEHRTDPRPTIGEHEKIPGCWLTILILILRGINGLMTWQWWAIGSPFNYKLRSPEKQMKGSQRGGFLGGNSSLSC